MANPPADALQAAAALFEARRLDEAAAACDRLLEAGGDAVHLGHVAHLAGLVAFERSLKEQGITLLRRALESPQRNPAVHANLAICLIATGEVTEGIAHAAESVRLAPTYAPAYAALADGCMARGAVGEAVSHLRMAYRIEPWDRIRSNMLYAYNFLNGYSPAEIAEEHRAFGRAHAPRSLEVLRYSCSPDPERKLRIGYLSADMRSHSVAHFLAPLLDAHDRAAVEVHGFASVARPDAITARLRALCDRFTDVSALSDDKTAALIRSLGIDILVELGGHTEGSRLLVLARRPAPVQISWLGYPNTTGVEAVRHRFTDALVDPEGEADRCSVESLLRLPNGFLCYEAPAGAPDVAPPPSTSRGFITFGSFNTLAKMTPKVVEEWARILKNVPGSRLFLKARPLADAGVREYVAQQLAAQGVPAERLLLEGRTQGQLGHLARYADVDIALDPYPYNGTTTTFEALWMGVPVIALEGDRHAARVSAAILKRLGLDTLVGAKAKHYRSIAVDLAKNPARLADLRAGMRARLQGSPLCDRAGFARQIEAAYRDLWRAWCAAARK